MSFLVRPSMQQPNGGPDEIDGLLRRFFQGEMPEPWPDCPRPEEPARVVVPDRTTASWWELPQRFASRLSLALSLAVLLAGAWLLSGSFTGSARPDAGPGVTAVGPRIEIHSTTADRNHGRTRGTPNYKVNEALVQPKDGPTQMNIEIIDVGPSPKR